MEDLLADPRIASDVSMRYMILYNMFTTLGDTTAARRLVDICHEVGTDPEEDPLLAAYLSEKEYDYGDVRKALRIARKGLAQARFDEDDDGRALNMLALANAFDSLRLYDSAYYYLGTYKNLYDSLQLVREPEEIKGAETSRLVSTLRME